MPSPADPSFCVPSSLRTMRSVPSGPSTNATINCAGTAPFLSSSAPMMVTTSPANPCPPSRPSNRPSNWIVDCTEMFMKNAYGAPVAESMAWMPSATCTASPASGAASACVPSDSTSVVVVTASSVVSFPMQVRGKYCVRKLHWPSAGLVTINTSSKRLLRISHSAGVVELRGLMGIQRFCGSSPGLSTSTLRVSLPGQTSSSGCLPATTRRSWFTLLSMLTLVVCQVFAPTFV